MSPFAFAVAVGVLEGGLCFSGLSWMLYASSAVWQKSMPLIFGVALPVGGFVGWQSFKSVQSLIGHGPSFLRTMAVGMVGGAFIGVIFILLLPFLAQEDWPSLSTLLRKFMFPWLGIGMVVGFLYAVITWLFNALLIRLASRWFEQASEAREARAARPAYKSQLVLASVLLVGLVIGTLVRQGWRDPEPIVHGFVPTATVTTDSQGLQGAVREDGKEVIPHRFAYVSQIGFEFFLVRAAPEEGESVPRYGVWTIEGREVFAPRYQGIQIQSKHRRFRVSLGEAAPKFGYLDEDGREVIPVIYDELRPISNMGDEPTVVAGRGSGRGYVDIRSGEVLIEPIYESLYVSDQMVDANGRGIVLARQQSKWGVLDTQGRALTAFQYDELDVLDHQTLRGSQGERIQILRFQGSKLLP